MIRYHQRPEVRAHRKVTGAAWRAANAAHLQKRAAERRLKKRAQCLIADARTRARRRGLEFALDGFVEELQHRIDRGVCEVTGVRLDLSAGRKWSSPSIDRINPKRGYLPDNVRLVCQAMNLAMGDWGEDVVWDVFQTWSRSRKSSSKRVAKSSKSGKRK